MKKKREFYQNPLLAAAGLVIALAAVYLWPAAGMRAQAAERTVETVRAEIAGVMCRWRYLPQRYLPPTTASIISMRTKYGRTAQKEPWSLLRRPGRALHLVFP